MKSGWLIIICHCGCPENLLHHTIDDRISKQDFLSRNSIFSVFKIGVKKLLEFVLIQFNANFDISTRKRDQNMTCTKIPHQNNFLLGFPSICSHALKNTTQAATIWKNSPHSYYFHHITYEHFTFHFTFHCNTQGALSRLQSVGRALLKPESMQMKSAQQQQ